MTADKRFWTRIAAGTVAIIAIVCGCSDKKESGCANAEVVAALGRVDSVLNNVQTRIADLGKENENLRDEIGNLTDENDALRDTIVVRDSTIAQLRDSLNDCRQSKECLPCKKKKAPVKKAPAKPVAVKPCEPKTIVEVVSGENKVVVNNDAIKPNQAVIVNGDNSGTVIVNANGIVSGNAIVNGNNNTVVNGNNNKVAVDKVAEARKKYVDACAHKKVIVLNERVQCYTK